MPATATGACSTSLGTISGYNPDGTDWTTFDSGPGTTPSASGTRYVRFQVVGKDSGSSGYSVAPNFVGFQKQ